MSKVSDSKVDTGFYFVRCLNPLGFHRVAVTTFGDKHKPILACVHGLTRNAADFFPIARALSEHFHVLCIDVVGRGKSDRLSDASHYNYTQYCNDIATVLSPFEKVYYLGTSMGGIIAMMLAARRNHPIVRLALNDIGAFVPAAGLKRISSYVGKVTEFENKEVAREYYRVAMSSFNLDGEELERFVDISLRTDEGDRLVVNYDPQITQVFNSNPNDISFWNLWDVIDTPSLIIHGALSDILLYETIDEMKAKAKNHFEVLDVPGVGHTPMLWAQDQIDAVVRFFVAGLLQE